jgi:hypothetical protein
MVDGAAPRGSTVKLTHYGRKTGKPYEVTLWFVIIDGEIWIGSLDSSRPWVKNVRNGGEVRLDFGAGPQTCTCEWIEDGGALVGFRDAVRAKYPIMSRVISLFTRARGKGCAFRVCGSDKAK